jgi:hypothetical protein
MVIIGYGSLMATRSPRLLVLCWCLVRLVTGEGQVPEASGSRGVQVTAAIVIGYGQESEVAISHRALAD